MFVKKFYLKDGLIKSDRKYLKTKESCKVNICEN